MAKGIIIDPKFLWNVEANVGPGMPNRTEDVQLIQFAYACKALNPRTTDTPADRAIYSAVVPGTAYNGSPTDPLSVAIRTHQKSRPRYVQDGVVSAIKTSTALYGENLPFLLVSLNNNMCDMVNTSWPRLDRHSLCPPALRDCVKRVLDPR